jgi:hypothetical protein
VRPSQVATPQLPAWLCWQSLGEGGKANDSLSLQLVTSRRHTMLCRTGATCCHSGSVQCSFSLHLDEDATPGNGSCLLIGADL